MTNELLVHEPRSSRRDSALPAPWTPLAADRRRALDDLVGDQASRTPRDTAIDAGDDVWPYGELVDAADRLANGLRENGLRDGDLIAIVGTRSATLVVAILGVLKARGRFLVVESRVDAPNRSAVVKQLQPVGQLIISDDDQTESSAGLVGIRHHTVLPADRVGLARTLDRFGDAPGPAGGRGDRPAYVALTSGSTGNPKAIAGRHAPVVNFLRWYSSRFGLSSKDRFAMLSAPGYDPLLRDIFVPLTTGGSLYVPSEAERSCAERLIPWLDGCGVSVLHLTPAFVSWLSAGDRTGPLPTVRLVAFAGEALRYSLLRRARRLFPNAVFVNFYGATETPQAMGYYEVPRNAEFEPTLASATVPIGRGIDGAQLLVLDQALEPCAPGKVGEIAVRSPYLADGYVGDDRATSERFLTSPFTGSPEDRIYRTGDFGYHDESGSVLFVGRRDRQVKLSGHRVELDDVEAAIASHPLVFQAAVTLRQAGAEPPYLEAHLTIKRGESLRDSEIRRFLIHRIAHQAIPAVFHIHRELPLSANGKIEYAALSGAAASAPRDRREEGAALLESALQRLWAALLGVTDVHRDQNLFEAGANSLLAATAASRITAEQGVGCRPVDLYIYPTVASFTAAFGGKRSAERSPFAAIDSRLAGRSARRFRTPEADDGND